MSNPLPADSISPLPQDCDLAALASSLQAALDALRPFLHSRDEPGIGTPEDGARDEQTAEADASVRIRAYRIRRAALEDEEDYLAHYEADDSIDLMTRVLDGISVTVTLMERIDENQALPAFFIRQLGKHIRESLDILDKIASFMAEMELIETSVNDGQERPCQI